MAKSTDHIKWGTVIWKIVTDKRFRFSFSEVILYALINADDKRGNFASGVLLFKGKGYEQDILK